MDFQVGDEVFCLLNGEGVVVEVNNDDVHPVTVYFGTDCIIDYCSDGYLCPGDKNPCLYHKGTVVTIKPAQSMRYKWVNVYSNKTGDCIFAGTYTSEAKARELSHVTIHTSYKYVDTIQLKPKGEN